MKKIASFLVLAGCGKSKTIVCSKDSSMEGASGKYTLTIKKGNVEKVEEEYIFHTATAASEYYNASKEVADYDVKLQNHSVYISYKGEKNIINRIFAADAKEKTIVTSLENMGYVCK